MYKHTSVLNVDKFPMFSIGWTWQEFCRDLETFVPLSDHERDLAFDRSMADLCHNSFFGCKAKTLDV